MGRTKIKKNNTGKGGKGKSLEALKRKKLYFGGANIKAPQLQQAYQPEMEKPRTIKPTMAERC